jgi:hypothetical protein
MGEKDLAYYVDSLLKHGLEYVGVINAQGRIIEHASKTLSMSHEKFEMLCMGMRLQHSMQSDFDDEFGTVRYIVTERSDLKLVSIPVSRNVLFAIMQKKADHIRFIRKIYSKQFSDTLKNQLENYNLVLVGK